MRISEQQSVRQAARRLAEFLGVPDCEAKVRHAQRAGTQELDALVECGSYKFALEVKSSGSLGNVFRAVHQLPAMSCNVSDNVVPLLVVPFMGESARAHCEEAGAAWLDLSGNAKIVAPGLYVHSQGHVNKFRRPGRAESAFDTKGSRVARWMLMNPATVVRQRTLAASVGLDEGWVSRVVRRLIEMGLLERVDGGIRAPNADNLLDAWRDEYRFEKHTIKEGHIAVAAGESVVPRVAEILRQSDSEYALTGLAAAWFWTRYARYRLSTVYLKSELSDELLAALGFRETSRGPNIWLVLPRDEGVFEGISEIDGVSCAHPVQVYLDLKSHPERASEAAEELRGRFMQWSRRDR